MADNKADSIKVATNQYQLKVYYTGETPADSGDVVACVDTLDKKHRPWLIKYYLRDGYCHQYADTAGIYHKLSQDIGEILDAIIVNNKQREALGKIVDKLLSNYLLEDMAHCNDFVADPFEH